MAERRMISKKVVQRDAFAILPDKAKVLYFYLMLEADDDGFVGNTRSVMRYCGANAKSLEALINEGFLIKFESEITAIRHWPMQNKVQKDRYNPTIYSKERSELDVDCYGTYFRA